MNKRYSSKDGIWFIFNSQMLFLILSMRGIKVLEIISTSKCGLFPILPQVLNNISFLLMISRDMDTLYNSNNTRQLTW